MKVYLLIIGIVMFLTACTTQQQTMMEADTNTIMDNADEEDSDALNESTDMMEQSQMMYSGNVLAGTTTPYFEFNKADYEKALAEDKVIVLYFYANWCPICKAEQPEVFAAFDELNKENVIGFRVNYKDTETDADEQALAKKFGITYQHTKIIIKDGQRVLRAPDSWDKERYITEINKVA